VKPRRRRAEDKPGAVPRRGAARAQDGRIVAGAAYGLLPKARLSIPPERPRSSPSRRSRGDDDRALGETARPSVV